MTSVRLVQYILDPFTGAQQPMAALVSDGRHVRVVRAPPHQLPAVARANVARICMDLEAEPDFTSLPIGAGPQVVLGEVRVLPGTISDVPAWVRDTLLRPAA